MNQKTTLTPETVALRAAFALHPILNTFDGFDGYEETKESFDRLYTELFFIARDEVSLEVEPVESVKETWWDYQCEIAEGVRDSDWFE